MKRATRSVNLGAGVLLAFVLGTGIVSAQTSNTSVVLEDNDDPVGCVVSVTAGTNIDFGDLIWDGDSYEGTTDSGEITVLVDTDTAPGNRDCPAVTVYGTDLILSAISAFPVTAISVGPVASLGSTAPGQTAIAANSDVPQGGSPTDLDVDLDESAVNDDAPIGTYTGTITFSIGTGLD